MLVFIASKKGQGQRPNDFFFAQEGELVHRPILLCSNPDKRAECGCDRSMGGLDTFKSTTTFTVEERNLTFEQYHNLILDSLTRAGWFKNGRGEDATSDVFRLAREHLTLAAGFVPGMILEVREGQIVQRPLIYQEDVDANC